MKQCIEWFNNHRKLILIALGLFVVSVVVIAITMYQYVLSIEDERFMLQEPQYIQVKQGDTLYHLLQRFDEQNLLKNSWRFKWLVRLKRDYSDIKQGYYRIEPQDTVKKVFTDIIEGKEFLFLITFIEGIRAQDAVSLLAQAENMTHELDSEIPLLEQLKIDVKHPEGLFFPDTYSYRMGELDKNILIHAHQRLKDELNEAWSKRDADLPYKNPYEMLIMASIIEKETSVEAERNLVSAVFVNRLRKRMRLQTDPTVIYGMGDRYQGNIRRKDLLEETAYNTYKINGLPPTPIALAGRASLQAAAHPAQVDYLYFVSKNDGSHYFSNNLRDHEAAVDQYQRNRKSRNKSKKKK